MGIIREPEGVDFIINSGPLTPEAQAEISAWIRRSRETREKAEAALAKLAAKALALPSSERTQLALRLLSSLAAEESDAPERAWAAAAVVQFEQLKPAETTVQPIAKKRRATKSPRKTKSSSAKGSLDSPSESSGWSSGDGN